jgi:hypothetical protein
VNAAELARALFDAKSDVDAAVAAYEQAIRDDAEADDTARRAKARAYLTCREAAIKADGSRATVAHIEALVDLETADQQKAARMAEGLKRSAGEALKAAMAWMGALQSLAASDRAEAALAKWEPREVAGA